MQSCEMGVTPVPWNLDPEVIQNNSSSANMQEDGIFVEGGTEKCQLHEM
jgi:hypothetical protein